MRKHSFLGLSKWLGFMAFFVLALAVTFSAYGKNNMDQKGKKSLKVTPSAAANAVSLKDFNHSASTAPPPVSVGPGSNQEASSGFLPVDSGTLPEQSPLIKELHAARHKGDRTKMLEIEAMLQQPRVMGEDTGEYTITPSMSKGGPGSPNYVDNGDKIVGSDPSEATFGTDIVVRDQTYIVNNPSMASASNGHLYVACEEEFSGDRYIQIHRSTDGGQTWEVFGYVLNSGADLVQPSIAIGEGSTSLLLVAYIVDDGVNIRHPEVAVTPLGQYTFTIVSIDYINGWQSYDKPVIWTDAYDWYTWYAYLTCEATVDSATNNINVAFWRSVDYGVSFSTHYTAWGNTDSYAWRDPDGTYGTTLNRVFLACFNDTDNNLYALSSDDFGANWNTQVIVGVDTAAWVDPFSPVNPDIEAATGHNNVMVVFTKSYDGQDNIGQTYSTDAGTTFPYSRWSLDGSDNNVNEFAPELTANEGGGSWHLAYTRADWWVGYTSRPQDLSSNWPSSHDVVNDIDWASAAYPKKGIASNWTTDVPGIAWCDYRSATGGDYDIYSDYDQGGGPAEPIIRIQPTSLNINQASAAGVAAEPQLETIQSDANSLAVKLTPQPMSVKEKVEGGDTYKVIGLGRYNGELPPGQPNLPAIRKYVYVPQGKSAAIETVTLGNPTEYTDCLVYPMQQPQWDTVNAESPAFYIDTAVYSTDEWLPKQMVRLGPVEIIRGHAVRLLSICPFQYNPAKKILRVFPEINAQILFNGQEMDTDSRLRSPVFDRFIKGFVSNPEAFDDEKPGQDAYTGENYLIITAPAFVTQANALAAHKTGRGISTGVVTTAVTGTTSTQIKAYIQNAYNTYNPAPTYVLLLGDVETIPTTYDGTADTGTDLYYSTVDGSDYVPDLFLGRISVDSASEADIVINKIIDYESNPPTSPSFYTNAAVAAYFQDYNDYNGYEDRRFVRTSEEVRDFLMGQGYNVQRIYYTEPAVTPTNYNNGYYGSGEPLPPELLRANGFAWDGDSADISAAINNGVFLLMHRDHGMDRNDGYSHTGWGDPYYVETHIAALTNGDLLPVVMSMNCQTGWFDGETDHHSAYNYESFCELFLRKSGGGTVGIFGATRSSLSGYNDFMAEGMIDCVYPTFLPTVPNSSGASSQLGPMLNHGKLAMDQLWGDPWGYRQLEYELFHVFGDPSLEMWISGDGGNSFMIYNDGNSDLNITSMSKRDGDAWLSWTPTAPLTISPGGSREIVVSVNWAQVPGTVDDERIIVYSNDSDMSPYPSAVYVTAEKSAGYGDELAADFGASGLWHYDGATWTKKTGWNADNDMAGWAGGLAADFGANGLWNYDGSTWTKKTGWNAGVGGMAGWAGGLAVSFDSNGLWNYDGTTWTKKTSWFVGFGGMASWTGGLAVDFDSNGLWNYDGSTWSKKTSWNTESGGMAGWSGGLAVDFGSNGLWNYDGTTWSKKTSLNPGAGGMAGWAGGLAVDFDGNGLWNYDGATWSKKTGLNPEGISALGDGFAADFGASGLWYYDGATWSKKTNWNAENLTDVDLY